MDITKLTGYTPGPLHVTGGFVLTWDFESTADCFMGKPATDQRVTNAELYALAPELLELAKDGWELADRCISAFLSQGDAGITTDIYNKARALREKAGV